MKWRNCCGAPITGEAQQIRPALRNGQYRGMVHMPMNTVLLSIDGSRVAGSLREILDKLEGAEGELVVDFSQVHRVDSADVQALEALHLRKIHHQFALGAFQLVQYLAKAACNA